ncbi:hypothetical protein AU195_09175 [Mycobacterium sp. IS-1496]|nr:hypothetical protein AU195_09175 [Mycobacterium sp. IS-1496]
MDANCTVKGLLHHGFWYSDFDLSWSTVGIELDGGVLSHHDETVLVVDVRRHFGIRRIEIGVCWSGVPEVPLPRSTDHVALLDPLADANDPLTGHRTDLHHPDLGRYSIGVGIVAVRIEGCGGLPIRR